MSSIENCPYMFWNSGISSTNGPDSWNLSSVNDMEFMFKNCSNLKDTSGLKNWSDKLKRGVNIRGLFEYSGIENIEFLKTWKLGNTENYDGILHYCKSLKNLAGLEGWDLGQMSLQYFFEYTGLEDISAAKDWNTSKVTNMEAAFYGCSSLQDATPISSWNIDNCSYFSAMFYGTKVTTTNKYPAWNGTWDKNGSFTPAS